MANVAERLFMCLFAIFMSSSVQYLFISFPHFLIVLLYCFCYCYFCCFGWGVSFVCLFFLFCFVCFCFCFTIEASQIWRLDVLGSCFQLWPLPPHLWWGMKALATEQSSFLDQTTCCDWSLFPIPSAYSVVSGRWRSILGPQGQVGSSAWAAVSLLLIPLATWVSFGKRGSLGPGRERECFPCMLTFGETPDGFFMPFVLGLPDVVKGISSTQGRNELTWAAFGC